MFGKFSIMICWGAPLPSAISSSGTWTGRFCMIKKKSSWGEKLGSNIGRQQICPPWKENVSRVCISWLGIPSEKARFRTYAAIWSVAWRMLKTMLEEPWIWCAGSWARRRRRRPFSKSLFFLLYLDDGDLVGQHNSKHLLLRWVAHPVQHNLAEVGKVDQVVPDTLFRVIRCSILAFWPHSVWEELSQPGDVVWDVNHFLLVGIQTQHVHRLVSSGI